MKYRVYWKGEYPALPEPATHQIAEVKSCEHGDAIIGWRVEPSRQSFNASMLPKRMLYTADQMRACMTLPEGVNMAIQLERHAGWIELHDSAGEQIELPNADGALAEQVHYAIDAARAAQEGKSHG